MRIFFTLRKCIFANYMFAKNLIQSQEFSWAFFRFSLNFLFYFLIFRWKFYDLGSTSIFAVYIPVIYLYPLCYHTFRSTKRKHRTSTLAEHLYLPQPSIRSIRRSKASRPSNQSHHPKMKSMLLVAYACIFITLIQGAVIDTPSPIVDAKAALTIPAVRSPRCKSPSLGLMDSHKRWSG